MYDVPIYQKYINVETSFDMACVFLTLHAAKKWTIHCWWLYDKERGFTCGETHNFCGRRYISFLFHVLFHGTIVFHSFLCCLLSKEGGFYIL